MKTFLLLLLFSSLADAGTFTPGQLATLAEERAPLIKMHLEGNAAASSQVSQSKLFANPVFALQSGQLRSGGQKGSVMDVTVNQPVPWPGKKFAEINSAKLLEKISEVDVEESRLIVNHSVSLLSVEYAVVNELVRHNQERKLRYGIIHKFLTSRPMASPRQMVEKNLIETQISLVEGRMFDLETKKRSLSEHLKKFTGEKVIEVNVDWKQVHSPPDISYFAAELENGPEFRRSKKLEELALNRVEEAKYHARPDIIVGVNYRQENIAPVNHFYHANLAVVIPIIDRGQHTMEVARAQARREEAHKNVVKLNANDQLDESYEALRSAYKSTEIFPISSIKKIDRNFTVAEESFRKGRIDVTTFLQSDVQIHEAIDLAYVSFVKYYTELSKLQLLTGKKLEIR